MKPSGFPTVVKRHLGKAILDLQKGHHAAVAADAGGGGGRGGVEKRDDAGIYRTFHFTKSKRGILIPHACVKKTQKTPQHEIALARRAQGDEG